MEINKKYFYEKFDTVQSGVLLKETRAFYIFDNGDHVRRYHVLYDTETEAKTTIETAKKIVKQMYIKTYVPETVHIPNRFTKINNF